MSVLARELDSYQRAVDAYQRQLNSYNRGVQRYNDTLVRDADGNLLVIDSSGNVQKVDAEGKVTPGALPSGTLQDYGLSAIPDESRFRMLRQGEPVESKRETLTGVQRFYDPESGQEYYYTLGPGYGDSGPGQERLSAEWRLERKIPGQQTGWGVSESYSPDTYEFSRDASIYMERPEEWAKQFTRKAPDPTFAQVKRAGMPSLAQIEGGLIGEVMRGKGVRYGVPAYRPPGAAEAPAPGTPVNVVGKPIPGRTQQVVSK